MSINISFQYYLFRIIIFPCISWPISISNTNFYIKLRSWSCYIYYSAKKIKKRPWYNNVKCCGINMPFAFSFAICNFHIAFAFLNERILCTWHYHVCRKHPKCNSLQDKGDEIMYAMHFPTKRRFISICQNFKQNAKLFLLF